MNTYSHAHIAVILHKRLQEQYGIKLPLKMFVYSNCRPDCSVKYKKVKHYKEDMYENIQMSIKDLMNCQKSKQNAYALTDKLGIICHFLCDFFCYAHTDSFQGTLREHMGYESKLNQYIVSNNSECEKFFENDEVETGHSVVSIWDNLDNCFLEYENAEQSFHSDVFYSLKACEQVIVPVLDTIVEKSQLSARRLVNVY